MASYPQDLNVNVHAYRHFLCKRATPVSGQAPDGEAGPRLPNLPPPTAALRSSTGTPAHPSQGGCGAGKLPHSQRRSWAQPHGAGRGQLGLSQPEERRGSAGTSPTSPKLAFNQSWLRAAGCQQPFGSPLGAGLERVCPGGDSARTALQPVLESQEGRRAAARGAVGFRSSLSSFR